MAQPGAQNFGDTISGGIQDIAALLPLLGTDQCERHVGEALQKGYLYAAATPLSIFGSLGVVKASFATFLATTTKPFYGGSWLHDAGFGTTGSVASMVTLAPGTKKYGAEVQLERLMREQHIDDPNMISGIEWFGWKHKDRDSGVGSTRLNLSWNMWLILTSALSSIIAFAPYVYLALDKRGNVLVWLFPALRSFGSFLCVVCVQLALQRRIHNIASSSLLLMKARQRQRLLEEEPGKDEDSLLECRLMTLTSEASDLEKGTKLEGHALTPPSVDIALILLQAPLVVGMGMMVAGYVGCFNLVSQTKAANGPYVWLGMEVLLSIIRIALWGSNPSWDEQNTGIVLRLEVLEKSISTLKRPGADGPTGPDIPLGVGLDLGAAIGDISTVQMYPIITSPYPLHILNEIALGSCPDQNREWRACFVAHYVEDFLTTASAYAGPLRRFQADGFSLYYAVVAEVTPDYTRKLLCVTVVHQSASLDAYSFLVSGGTSWQSAFVSSAHQITGTRALEVVFKQPFDIAHELARNPQINSVVEYSNVLFRQLVAPESTSHLSFSWSLCLSPTTPSSCVELYVPLSFLDKEYMRMGQMCDLKGRHFDIRKGLFMDGVILTSAPTNTNNDGSEEIFDTYGLMVDSAIQEIYLCVMEQDFVRRAMLSDSLSHSLALQWIQQMDRRLSSEKSRALNSVQIPGRKEIVWQMNEAWDSFISEISSIRLLPEVSPTLQRWKDVISGLINVGCYQSSESPPPIPSFTSEAVHNELLRYFPLLDHPEDYREFVGFVCSSLQYLHSVEPSPYFGRMDPQGPGSPYFSPPYTSLHTSVVSNNAQPLLKHINSIKVLILSDETSTVDAYEKLSSLTYSPAALTTLVHVGFPMAAQHAYKLCSILEKHRDITSALLYGCYEDSSSSELVQRAVLNNCRKWREDASNRGDLTYQIGLKDVLRNRISNRWWGVRAFGYDSLLLQDFVAVAAMIHIPVQGTIVPVLSVKTCRPAELKLVASLVYFPVPTGDEFIEICRIEQQVEPSGWNELRFDDLACGPPGCYEVHISASSPPPQRYQEPCFAFRNLTIEFTPKTEVHITDEPDCYLQGDVNDDPRHSGEAPRT